jgi:hypothetical protein
VGSRLSDGEPARILAREIKKGNAVWTLRNATGQPRWTAASEQPGRFWTKKKVIVIGIVAAKVVALATVLRH